MNEHLAEEYIGQEGMDSTVLFHPYNQARHKFQISCAM